MELFNYLLKVSACTALFYTFYLLVLKRLTFFRTNRFYLLVTLILSFIIPSLSFTIEREVAEVPIAYVPTETFLERTLVEQPIISEAVTFAPKIEENFDWYSLLPNLYLAIVACLLGITFWRLLQLFRHTKKNFDEINGLKIVAKSSGFTNCSFFNYVFIDNENISDTELQVLLRHETVHAKQFHSVDKMLLMFAKAILWFNPIIYLYDKALEQAHEYEADEATSKSFGTEQYANLLLKLAIAKSEMPLVHNFVKSPIKERIKMLFNTKSKNMKKLMYLLALPIGLGLLWGFTVDVVNVLPEKKQSVLKGISEKQDSLIGKTFKGKVIGFEKKDKLEILNFQVGKNTIPLSAFNFKGKVKVGDEIEVTIGGSGTPPAPIGDPNRFENVTAFYFPSKVLGTKGKLIYEIPHYAFLYEANRARFADSKIKSISKNQAGYLDQIVLNDGEFTIKLKVSELKVMNHQFKVGDEVRVKFIGEKKINEQVYQTNQLIALYAILKYGEKIRMDNAKKIINDKLYPKFYETNGRQKIKESRSTKGEPSVYKTANQEKNSSLLPIFISSTSSNEIKPFIVRTILSSVSDDFISERITLNVVSGEPLTFKMGYDNSESKKPSIWVYINDKIYTEEDALKFDKNLIANLAEKRGYGTIYDYDLPSINKHKFGYVFWFGDEPKLSPSTAKNRAISQKYSGTTVEGKVLDFTYSSKSNQVDGFLVKTNRGEILKTYVEPKFAKQVAGMIAKNDHITVKIYNSAYWKDSEYPVMTSIKLMKAGKVLYDRSPKTVAQKSKTNVKPSDYKAAIDVQKSLPKPILLSSSSLKVDTKNNINYVKDAIYMIGDVKLVAKSSTFDKKNNLLKAQEANITKNGHMIVSDEIIVGVMTNVFTVKEAKMPFSLNTFSKVDQSYFKIGEANQIKYSAIDSINVNKSDQIIKLYNGIISNNKMKVKGSFISYNGKSNTAIVKDGVYYDDKTEIKAEIMEVDFNTAKVISKKGDLKMTWK